MGVRLGLVVGVICGLSACAIDPVTRQPAGGDAPDPAPPSPPPPSGFSALAAAPIDAIALAANDAGIYWTTSANELWVLRTGRDTPERLAVDPEAGPSCEAPSAPLLAGGAVFWLGSARSALHRTRADGTRTEVISAVVRGDNLAADTANVYWTEALGNHGQGEGAVRMLPLDAAMGATPVTLVTTAANQEISSLAVRDGVAYWTPFSAIGGTTFDAVLHSARVVDLAAGDHGTIVAMPGNPFGLFAAADALYFTHFPNLWTTAVGRLPDGAPPVESLLTLPVEQTGTGFAIAGDSVVVTAATPPQGCGQTPSLNLFAASARGGQASLIADQMRTPAIATAAGIAFVAADGRLMAMSADYMRALRIALAP